jgi:hypothetical protein
MFISKGYQLYPTVHSFRFFNPLAHSQLTRFYSQTIFRQLLGTEEDSSDHASSDDDDELVGAERREHRKNVWNITKEQLNYYTTQFFSMQTNPEGVIPGNQVS